MSVAIKNLSAGTLSTGSLSVSKGPLTGKAWIVKSIILTNRETTARTVDVKVAAVAGAGFIAPPGMSIPGLSTAIIDSEITLAYSSGSVEQISILVGSASATGVDYVMNGLERDL